MKTRIVHTKIWSDAFYGDLSPIEKFLFLYFITNENVNIIHYYECPDRKIMFDTGVTREQLDKAKLKFETAGKIFFHGGYILLKNAHKYEEYTGEKNEKAKEDLLQKLDKGILDWYKGVLEGKNTPIDRGIDEGMIGVYIPTINHKSEIINQKEGGVRGKQASVEDITDEIIDKISQDYHLPRAFVASKADDLRNWCVSKGKSYKDYPAALRNWVKKDAEKIVQAQRLPSKSVDASSLQEGGKYAIGSP